MIDPSCGDCRFYEGGVCHRYPPIAQRYEYTNDRKGYTESDIAILWPAMDKSDWCGEFKERSSP